MKEHIKHQILDHDGTPMFVVIPYDEYLDLIERWDRELTIPQEVIEKTVLEEKSKMRAWREYKKFSQKDVAERMNVSQAAYSQMEKPGANLRRTTLKKIADALGIHVEQLIEP